MHSLGNWYENTKYNKHVDRRTWIVEDHRGSHLRDARIQLETSFLADAVEGHGPPRFPENKSITVGWIRGQNYTLTENFCK